MSGKQGFLAYDGSLKSLGETLESSIIKLNKTAVYDIKSWKTMNISGTYIINEICSEINKREIFICDLTKLNSNVLFELGYAIIKRKKLYIIFDKNQLNTKNQFDSFGLLTTIGYIPYSNSIEIEAALFEDNIDEEKESLVDIAIDNMSSSNNNEYYNLFYMKSCIETDASIKLARIINDQKLKIMIDDPFEISTRTLSWYIESIINSNGIIAHFLSDTHENNVFHNAKLSFVCGMAYALDIPILMLAHAPYKSPIDYKDIMKTHETATQCMSIADEWLRINNNKFREDKTYKRFSKKDFKAQSNLQKLNLGDIVAEYEINMLNNYFVRTASFEEALRSNHSIFIGRKGSGKTANLINLNRELNSIQNHVCVIKPVAYDIEGILEVLRKDLSKAERGYLVESLWKFLIYTELAKSVYSILMEKPDYYQYLEDEENIIQYVEKNTDIILQEFSVRLDYAVEKLSESDTPISLNKHKQRISELLHDNIINRLRSVLGNYLSKKAKVAILIDNLDKAWNYNTDVKLMSEFIFGLLDVGDSILKDFSRDDHWRKPANLSLIIFLRDDIFNQISKYAPEKDKLPIKRILWKDPDVLLRVIEERISDGENVDIWSKYFCNKVNDQNIKSYLCDNILPRPRDMVFLVKEALSNAINRKHSKIYENDILDAQNAYSKFAFDTLISENGNQISNLESILYEFAGSSELVFQEDILEYMRIYALESSSFDDLIQCLCNLSFLGIETDENNFTFIYNEEDFLRYKVMANRIIRKDNKMRFKIHKAFHSFLEIKCI